jgi:hypothetical protein
MSFPKPPENIVAFNSGVVAPHDIGRQFDEHRRGISGVINFLRTIFRDDGVMRETSMPPPGRGSSKEPTLPMGALGPNAGGFYAGDDKGATAVSSDYAQVAIEWAEHMPDAIPPDILAINAITGDHWSSRWWANRAAQIVSSVGAPGTIPGSQGVFTEALTVTAMNTCANLAYTPAGPVLLVVNGMSFLPVGSTSPPFTVTGKTINWLSSIYSLIPGQTDVAAWYPYAP